MASQYLRFSGTDNGSFISISKSFDPLQLVYKKLGQNVSRRKETKHYKFLLKSLYNGFDDVNDDVCMYVIGAHMKTYFLVMSSQRILQECETTLINILSLWRHSH